MIYFCAPMQSAVAILLSVIGLSYDHIVHAELLSVVSVVVAAFAITISCAGRPAAKIAFISYGVLELVAAILAVVLVLVPVGSQTCTMDGGSVDSSDGCAALLTGQPTVADAQVACATAADQCVFSTACGAAEAADVCEKIASPSQGVCTFSNGKCGPMAATLLAAPGSIYADCLPTSACRFGGLLLGLCVFYVLLLVSSVVAVVHIIWDAKKPVVMAFQKRSQDNLWSQAVQASMDHGAHGRAGASQPPFDFHAAAIANSHLCSLPSASRLLLSSLVRRAESSFLSLVCALTCLLACLQGVGLRMLETHTLRWRSWKPRTGSILQRRPGSRRAAAAAEEEGLACSSSSSASTDPAAALSCCMCVKLTDDCGSTSR